ncbi:MAG: hypothetical protein RMK19_02695 [Bacteroidia bacterium]|nr:hypothetical protein [Bacteroidia bacterium]MDW8014903.1 hypothetical protein [Bacteroidia bacterium]
MQKLPISWESLCEEVKKRYSINPSEEVLLFLVGLHKMGFFPQGDEKTVKLNLIQLGGLVLLERAGYMREIGTDPEGWPLWERAQSLPSWTPGEQQRFIREALIQYFTEIWEL